jgi:hypothetical protein
MTCKEREQKQLQPACVNLNSPSRRAASRLHALFPHWRHLSHVIPPHLGPGSFVANRIRRYERLTLARAISKSLDFESKILSSTFK